MAGQWRGDHCGVFYFRGVWWRCVAEGVGEFFCGFEGEACGFSGSEYVIRIVWVGFVVGGFVRVELDGKGGGGDRNVGVRWGGG